MDASSHKKMLFQRFLRGQCTAAERDEVLAYIRASQVPAEFEALMQENLDQKISSRQQVSAERSARMLHHIERSTIPQKAIHRKIPVRRLLAAACFLCCVIAGCLYFYLPASYTQQIYTTAYGETRRISLPDGSIVMLNANSRLTLGQHWQQDTPADREVWLEGEAFFEVTKQKVPARFLVHTAALQVEVLGTRFNVNARQQKTQVVLDEGSVKLKSEDEAELLMQPGELAELAGEDALFQIKQVDPDRYLSWRHNELVFEATPMTDIIVLLENNYGYKVIVRNQSVREGMLFTGKVPADEVELLLRMLSESFSVQVRQEEGKIIFQ